MNHGGKIPALDSCEALDKIPDLSVPQFPHEVGKGVPTNIVPLLVKCISKYKVSKQRLDRESALEESAATVIINVLISRSIFISV